MQQTDRPPLGWRLRRAWAQGTGRWWALAAALLLSGLVLVAGLLSQRRAHDTLLGLQARLAAERSASSSAGATASVDRADFARSLGHRVSSAQLVQELQRAVSEAGVLLASLQTQERPASTEQLGRLELTITLRGAYPATKQVLKQVLERFPNLTVQRLRMRRSQSLADVETSVTLSVWSAPLLTVGTQPVARQR